MFTPRSLGALSAVLAAAIASNAHAALLFNGTSGTREADVTVEVDGDDLVITLANTSGFDVVRPSDLLTAMFFEITEGDDENEDPISLTPVSAVLGNTSVVLFDDAPSGGNVGGEWAYNEGLNNAPGGVSYGIGSAGLNIFGPHERFPGDNLDGPNAPNGMGYALTSESDDPGTGNMPVTGKNPLIKHEVRFTLTGLPENFDINRIESIFVQYGTSIIRRGGEDDRSFFELPLVPAPSAAIMLATGGLVALGRRRRA